MHSGPGAEDALGLFINTLPLRIELTGSVRGVIQTHERLASLLEHEHASLVRAQQCSNVPQGTPMFSAMLNYRHNGSSPDSDLEILGIEYLESHERTNYPFTLAVEDYGTELGLTAKVVRPIDPERICGYMHQALQSLSDAVDHSTDVSYHHLEIVPEIERQMVLRTWNATQQNYPSHLCIHHLFEQQVERSPQATALVFNDKSMTYTELNERSNRLAHHLINLGVQPDSLVVICVERSFAMIVGLLSVLKAGGAYVPLDPSYASSRLRDIFMDASPSIIIADESGRAALGDESLAVVTTVDPNTVLDGKHDTTRYCEEQIKHSLWTSHRNVPY
jgi:non-ribosomal peptide synthetase component F